MDCLHGQALAGGPASIQVFSVVYNAGVITADMRHVSHLCAGRQLAHSARS